MSSSKEMFESVTPRFQEALKNAGYDHKLEFKPNQTTNKKPRCHKRNALYFNPPWAMNIKTNVGAKFLKLLDKHFPKYHPLHKILNRHNAKVSYRNTPNIKQIITSHNKKVLQEGKRPEKPCNCKDKSLCPIDGKCLNQNLIYQATIVTAQPEPETHTYIGLTATTFKERLSNHKTSFNKEKYKNATTLSQFIWSLKEQNIDFNLKWRKLDQAAPFNPISGKCNLCTLEKYYLIFKPDISTLNKNEELNNFCLHKRSQLLENT